MNLNRFYCAILIFNFPYAAFAFDESAIKSQCGSKWGADFSMVDYCRKKQRQSGESVDKLMQLSQKNMTLATIMSDCERKWGTDYSMIEYCAGKQVKSIKSISQSSSSDIPDDIRGTILSGCKAKWKNDFSMVAYCIDKQSTAWRNLQ